MNATDQHERGRIRRAALAGARALGCTCSPDITVRDLGHGLYDTTVAHDDWCPLAIPTDQVVLIPGAQGRDEL
jgi:hypothetical protein